jgi:cytochrome c-type biogenesis protein CcmH/NrfG
LTKHKYEHHQTSHPEPEINGVRAPYWARAHRDWRFLAVVFVMLVAIGVYVMTGNLSWRSHGQEMPLLDAGGK